MRDYIDHKPMAKLKIVVLGTRGFPNVQGGVEEHCRNLYPRLVKRGCDVVVLTRKPYVDPNLATYEDVHLIPLSCPKNKFLEAFTHTFLGIFFAKKMHPDLIHVHAVGPALFIPVARFLGLKVVMTNHGPDYQRKKWNKLAKMSLKLGERLGSRWANAIICISESIAEAIRKEYNREVTVIPNGVTIPEVLQTDDTLRKYGLQKGKYILAVGRLVPEKGFHDLMNAFNYFQTPKYQFLNDGWKLAIVGSADHEDQYSLDLKEKARKNCDIVLTGFLAGKSLSELYSHAGLFVLPSYHEGLPIVLLEAMIYGLSCIASDIPANRNVELSENRFFKVGDPEALAITMKEFVGKPTNENERRKQIDTIAKKFDWEKIAEKTLKVFTDAIGGKK
ncbi:MAG: glycosyltransferase [Candidatus Brocadia sp. AMX3]|nr:D-inositol-3-phosphate glycosyltransferase [Anaerolineales bacterium]MCE7912679.1 glycosyltransferase [Candidatus Brocadia sp. AMX3]